MSSEVVSLYVALPDWTTRPDSSMGFTGGIAIPFGWRSIICVDLKMGENTISSGAL